MAGVLAGHLFAQEGQLPVEIKTAGLSAFPGMAPSDQAVEVMEEKGLDLSRHAAECVGEEMVEWADLILTMTWGHKKRLLQHYPAARGKVFTLKEYGQPLPEAERALALQEAIIEKEAALLAAHKDELDDLLKQQQRLRQELEAVEAAIGEWQTKFAAEIAPQEQELAALEQKIIALDIGDPFGGTVEIYRQAAREIEDALAAVIRRLVEEQQQ